MILNRNYILNKLKDINIENLENLTLDELIDIIEICLNDFQDELK